jgi:hypothetical protein
MEEFKRILIVTKFTKHCRRAIHYGILIAKQSQSQVHVLHLMHDPFGLEHWQLALPSLKDIKEQYQHMRLKVKNDLDEMIAAEQAKGTH